MKIGQRFECVTGTFDTEKGSLVCVRSRKHMEVELCFRTGNADAETPGMNIPFAQIKPYGSGLFKDADATFDDAVALGDEIARRFNEFQDKR